MLETRSELPRLDKRIFERKRRCSAGFDRTKARDGLAMLGNQELATARHPVEQCGEMGFGVKGANHFSIGRFHGIGILV